MGEAARAAASAEICRRLLQHPQLQQARCVAAFAPMAEEVDIWPLIEACAQQGKTVALPRVADKSRRLLTFHRYRNRAHLASGYQAILEPAAREKIISPQLFDFIIVPAVGADKSKKRLGYGGGFYDRVLADCRDACSCAPLFRCQLAGHIPCESHDQSVCFVVTE